MIPNLKPSESCNLGGFVITAKSSIEMISLTEYFNIPIKSHRGNWLFNSIVSYFDIKPICKGNIKIQVSPYYNIDLYKKIGRIEIYKRFLGDIFIDYAIWDGYRVFHSPDKHKLVQGFKAS